ncbi:MAG: PmoA family protein [Firmicutes bacterium]|nr:PmoA family protein [Bacillota bacterium]
MTLTLRSGRHGRKDTPVFFRIPASALGGEPICAKLGGGERVPVTCAIEGGQAELCFVVPCLPAGETLPVTLEPCGCPPQMACEQTARGVDLFMRGEKFTEYYTGRDLPKPYLGPLTDAFGNRLTRLDLGARDHPHHRSLWISQEANGIDFWNEPKLVHGFIRNQSISDIVNGGAYTAFTAHNLWTSHGGRPVMDETTRFTLYNTPREAALLDVCITYTASYGDVTLGATKEAGPLAVRMSPGLSVGGGTGTIVSGMGGVDEAETWMRRAPWLDYRGTAEGHACGVAMLDHPDNFGFPTHWHVRDGGLMAGNNFLRMGAMELGRGETVRWKYRVVIHNGDTKQADIAGKFADFAFPAVAVADA